MTNPMQPLKQFMDDALVTESFKYKDNHDTKNKIREYYDQASKSHEAFKAEFEALKSRMENMEACFSNFRMLKNKLESFNDWLALAQHTNEFEEESFEYYLTDISQILQKLKDEPASKEFSKQIKEYTEIYQQLVSKAEELK